ncbi:MAG: iron-containing alcohol dehydrogenase family protein [Gemmatimonadales bacterium]|nr:iron-containing alcohol dehydrogenase family protein [Gemmatimonadales bacterium]
MPLSAEVSIPSLVRVKPGAVRRAGLYLRRAGLLRVALMQSEGLPAALLPPLEVGLRDASISVLQRVSIAEASFEAASALLAGLPPACQAVIGYGGGKALDTAKYVSHLAQIPFLAVPTSLANDGFASPQSSLTLLAKRRSLPARVPFGVVIDPDLCLGAPLSLWHSGVGELASKVTAVADWKLAFHARGTPVDDYAALLADTSVLPFAAHPARDAEGLRLLATGLMLSCMAMAMAGTSRPASGSEHLVSHALDGLSTRPRLHGLQVGLAAYLVSRLQGTTHPRVASLLDAAGFFESVRADPFDAQEWLAAIAAAPTMKPDHYTVLSSRDRLPELRALIERDPRLHGCFQR